MKTILQAGLILTSLTLIAWSGSLLYWHLRLSRALRTLEEATVVQPNYEIGGYVGDYSAPRDARTTLMNAGCRSLPYLVSSLGPAQRPEYLAAAGDLIIALAAGEHSHTCDDSAWEKRFDRFLPLSMYVHERPEARELKRRRIHDWWRDHGSEVHAWWRSWSACCSRGQ